MTRTDVLAALHDVAADTPADYVERLEIVLPVLATLASDDDDDARDDD